MIPSFLLVYLSKITFAIGPFNTHPTLALCWFCAVQCTLVLGPVWGSTIPSPLGPQMV